MAALHALPLTDALKVYKTVWESGRENVAQLARVDRFFLLTGLLNRTDAIHPWIYARCREVEANPNGYLDLWAREHYKSTIITFAGLIQEILKNPDVTIGIFSNNRPNAKKFLSQIKTELETNERLQWHFPDILYAKPKSEAIKWSENEGIIVKRKSNPREATIEAHGIVDGLPAGPHFQIRNYDDIVTEDSVGTPESIDKTTHYWRQSLNLGREGGVERYAGTIYHFADTYQTMRDERYCATRIYPATLSGKEGGEPVLMARESLAKKRRGMGPYIFGCQMLLDPTADDKQTFKREWLRFHRGTDGEGMNKYILVDPAGSKTKSDGKKRGKDYTAMWVIGLGTDRKKYVLDIVRDRLDLKQRTAKVFELHRRWRPLGVGYEEYGKDSDIEHIESEQQRTNYRFSITPLGGNKLSKEDRIRKLMPDFEQGDILLPEAFYQHNAEGQRQNLVNVFVEQEYTRFPVASHDDMLDCLSRIKDEEMYLLWPMSEIDEEPKRERYKYAPRRATTWMAR